MCVRVCVSILCPRLGTEWIGQPEDPPNSLRSKPRTEYSLRRGGKHNCGCLPCQNTVSPTRTILIIKQFCLKHWLVNNNALRNGTDRLYGNIHWNFKFRVDEQCGEFEAKCLTSWQKQHSMLSTFVQVLLSVHLQFANKAKSFLFQGKNFTDTLEIPTLLR